MRTRKFISKLIPALPMLLAAFLVILVVVIFLTAMRSKAHAQFGGVEQPMFQLTSTADLGLGASNWWVFTDIPTNTFVVNNWTDRVASVIQTNVAGATPAPTNTPNGIWFSTDSTGLRASYSNHVWGAVSNYTTALVWRPVNDVAFCVLFTSDSGLPHQAISRCRRLTIGSPGAWRIGSTADETTFSANFALNADTDIVIVVTNATSATVYTNGVLTAWNNKSITTSDLRPTRLGITDAANRGLQGYIKEVLYTPTNLNATWVSNFHYYATNKYLYTP